MAIDLKILFRRLQEMEVKRVTLSYLHLRPAIQKQLMKEISPLHRRLIESCFKTQEWKAAGSSTKTKLLPRLIREKGYQRIKGIAEELGITASVCQCKNPDLKGDLFRSGRARAFQIRRRTPAQLPLFQC